MPRNEQCPEFKECLAGLGETEIDWHCDHCDVPDRGLLDPSIENITAPPDPDPDVAIVLRALESPKVKAEICKVISSAILANHRLLGELRSHLL